MTPYYDDGRGIQIFHGDCREVLPTLPKDSIDLILTDPPYGVNWQSSFRSVAFAPIVGDDGTLNVLDALRLSLGPLRNHRHIYCFGPVDLREIGCSGLAELIWDKEIIGLGDLALPWGPSHERIAFGVAERSDYSRANGAGRLAARMRQGSVIRCPRPNGVGVQRHPTEKPVLLLRQLIEASSVIGETVLDLFLGCGSTLVAARLEGRRAVGIEIEEKFCETAAGRLQQQVLDFGEGAAS